MKKILIIDDELNFCKLIKMNLELIGNFEVNFATSGEDGLNAARKLKPDLILLDIMMPGMDGFEVLKALKEDKGTKHIFVSMLTARGDDASRIRAMQLCDGYYITKPVEITELKAKIENLFKK